jgi:hypothetical protein
MGIALEGLGLARGDFTIGRDRRSLHLHRAVAGRERDVAGLQPDTRDDQTSTSS